MGAAASAMPKYRQEMSSRDLSRRASKLNLQTGTIQQQTQEAAQRRRSVDMILQKARQADDIHAMPTEYHVYFAYAAGKDSLGRSMKDRVSAIHKSLVAKGLLVWFDAEKNVASSKMIDHGVLSSSVVVVFLTRAYMNQVNSDGLLDSNQYEFCQALATQTMTHIVLCVMEEDMKRYDNLTGEWREIVGDCECLDFTDETLLDVGCDELAEKIRALNAMPRTPVDMDLAGVKDLIRILKNSLTPRPTCTKVMRRLVGLAMLAPFADKMVVKGLLPALTRLIGTSKLSVTNTELALLLLKIIARTSCIYRRKIVTLIESRHMMPLLTMLLKEGEGLTKEHAAGLVRNLFSGGGIKVFEKNEWFQELVTMLVQLLERGTSSQQYEAGGALGAIALNKEYQPSIVKENGIRVCMAQMTCPSTVEGVREKAAVVLRCLSATEENQREIGIEGGVVAFLTLLQNGTPAQRETSSAALNWLMEVPENRTILVKERGIRTLLNFVVRGQKFVRQQSISALSKLAPHSEFQVPLAQAGVLGPCVAIMETGNDSQKTAACSILLAVASTEAMAGMTDTIPSVVKLYNSGTLSQKQAAKQVLERLCRHKALRGTIVSMVGEDHLMLR
ncbi:hypothetical protein H310_03230 [Aphanomyces invadans]|uniref:TIR domain-containing protein n=1 Tax=Aphanomyces invadans TaxID=157072 RepID=A0A024UHY9_9STRA|nr:hypothetical protein H310_03230 [Aphanomyces invadans]ETW05467.1 hypothetical protein H310_03230 [Aphanomyces invadans]|eukprot:XP_008865244.1 hypothetical protein H310_03230 [Aphanomyces invadans]